jgi:hypothetical protein
MHIHNTRHGQPLFTEERQIAVINDMLRTDPASLTEDMYELAVSGKLAGVFAYFGVTMKVEHQDPDVLNTLTVNNYAKLDLLGYGVATSTDFNAFMGRTVYFPVLDYERLGKALVFPKSHRSFEKLKSEVAVKTAQHIVALGKFQSLTLVGSWLSPYSVVTRAAFYRARTMIATVSDATV